MLFLLKIQSINLILNFITILLKDFKINQIENSYENKLKLWRLNLCIVSKSSFL